MSGAAKNDASARPALTSERAGRIIDAMRLCVARSGVAGATFDDVAREAGVSRGLLHYYFGTKQRLLIEVARRDAKVRIGQMAEELEHAATVDEVISAWGKSLRRMARDETELVAIILELYALSPRVPEVRAELGTMVEGMREAFAEKIVELRGRGRLPDAGAPEAIASVLLALAYGMLLLMLAEPDGDHRGALELSARATMQVMAPGQPFGGGSSATEA